MTLFLRRLLLVFALGLGLGLGVPAGAAIRGAKIATVADDHATSKVQPSDVNPLTEPSVPDQGDLWLDITGDTPTRTIELKVYDQGSWTTLASTIR